MNSLYEAMPTTIFTTMSALAAEHGAINLGQGFPDKDGPLDIRQRAAEALIEASNQYAPSPGLPQLREAVARHYGRVQGLALDASMVTVTSGATEALAAAILALVSPGDEVVVFEPAYDAYTPQVIRAGGVPRHVRLRPPRWEITREALEAVTSSRTKLLIFNNPQNPAARVYGPEELQVLAEWCVDHDAIAISDEVWEHVVFGPAPFVSLMSLPGMAERTVKVGSAGKMFSLTGWKVGFVCSAEPMASVIRKAHQFLTFATPPNLQWAVAYGLDKEEAWFQQMRAELARSRDRLSGGLEQAGYAVLPAEGTYFLNIDLAASGLNIGDREFCERAVSEAKVAAIPVSAFYAADPGTSVVRLCFAKADATLDEAVGRLAGLVGR